MSVLPWGAILLGVLSSVLSQDVLYVVSDDASIRNYTCVFENEAYHPCMTLKILSGSSTNNYSSVYLLENLELRDNITLRFVNPMVVTMQPMKHGSPIEVDCLNDVTFIYGNVEVVTVKYISFYNCGKLQPTIILNGTGAKSRFKVANVRFMQNRYSSMTILSDVIEVLILDSVFYGAFKEYAIIFKSNRIKCNISNSLFSGNKIGSIWYNTSHNSTLYISYSEFINNTSQFTESSSALRFFSAPNLTITNCNFINNTPRGALLVDVKNHLPSSLKEKYFILLVNCSFHNNTAPRGGAVFINDDTSSTVIHLSIRRSNFTYNEAENDGGALMLHEGTIFLAVNNSVFSNNSALNGSGGSLSIFTPQRVSISYCSFTGNSAAQRGGAIDIQGASSFEMLDCIFVANKAVQGGALMLHSQGNASIYHVTFLGNSAKTQGGAIRAISQENATPCKRATNQGRLNVTSSIFANNTAAAGGALSASEYEIVLCATQLKENRASEKGGGGLNIFISDMVRIKNSTFASNVALYGNGGFMNISHAGEIIVTHSRIVGNKAKRGGAVSITGDNSTSVRVINSEFIRNRALTGGAVEVDIWGNVSIITSVFRSNLVESGDGSALNVLRVKHFFVEASQFDGNKGTSNNAALRIKWCDVSYFVDTAYRNNQGGGLHWHGNTAFIQNCSFINNNASGNNLEGGGANLRAKDILIICSSQLYGNCAKSGGALKIYGTMNNSVVMFANMLESNHAEIKGGAISACDNFKEFFIMGSNFSNNSAPNGGALSLTDVKSNVFRKKLDSLTHFLLNTSISVQNYPPIDDFEQNISYAEMAINFYSSIMSTFRSILKMNTSVVSHDVIHNNTIKGVVIVNCSFERNQANIGGAMHVNSSSVLLFNFVAFQNLALSSGGGIAAFLSQMELSGTVKFESNNAHSTTETHIGRGGAIFIQDSKEICVADFCPIFWTPESHLNFTNNLATEGPTLYGGMLDRCSKLSHLTISSVFNTSSASSTATMLCFCQGADVNCDLRKISHSYYPGEEFYVQVACVDQLKKPLGCILKSKYHYNIGLKLGKGEKLREIGNTCHKLSFHLYTHLTDLATLQIRSKNTSCQEEEWNSLSVIIQVKSCPVGFHLDDDQCQCDKRLQKCFTDMRCYLESRFDLKGDGWLSYSNKCLIFHERCPLNYCYHEMINVSLHNPDNQCTNNRGGILCGGCVANYSVVLGSWKCMDCSHLSRYNFIWLTALLALAGVVLVVFLLLVKMTVSSGTTNGLIFYANILSFSGLLDYRTCSIHPTLRIFLSWINLDLGIEVCYYSEMDVYQKTWLQFIFPFYIWFLVGVIILFCHYSSRVMKLMGMRNIEVLATLFLLSYAKLLKTIVTSLTFTDVKVASAENISQPTTSERVWLYDGNIRFLSDKHLILFISALTFLFILFLPYTIFLLCGHFIQHLPHRTWLKCIQNPTVFAMLDVYHAPYTKNHRYWTGLGLLMRCLLYTAFSTSYNLQYNIFWTILAVTAMFLMKMAFRSGIYRKKYVEIFELLNLSNLLLLMVILHQHIYCSALQASIAFSLLLFICTVSYHVYQEVGKKLRICSYLKTKFKRMEKPPSQDNQTLICDDQLEHSLSHYVELRESLID